MATINRRLLLRHMSAPAEEAAVLPEAAVPLRHQNRHQPLMGEVRSKEISLSMYLRETVRRARPGSGATGAGSSTSIGGSGSNRTGGSGRSSGAGSKETVSKSSSSKTLGKGSVMKDGVLYVFDDDAGNPVISKNAGSGEIGNEENTEEEMQYAASDLALDGQLREKEFQKGFWETWPGYAVIIGSAVILLAIVLFFLFFGVIVFGEAEEHDEVFELCSVRIMKRRDGNWCVNLGNAFDDNAVVRLRIGILFAIFFNGWDVNGEVEGIYEGQISGQAEQNMMFYRRNIRRSV